jgi:hypothetical protein
MSLSFLCANLKSTAIIQVEIPQTKQSLLLEMKTTIGRKYAENLMWNFIALILGRRLESVYVKLHRSNTVILGGRVAS